MFPQATYNQDYARSDYSALLETNYALAQAQITQVQINQVTTFSRMKEENNYPPSAHVQAQSNNLCREKGGYPNYPPVAHSSVGLSDHLHKTKIDRNQNSNSPNLTNITNINVPTNISNTPYNWMKNEGWSHGNTEAAIVNTGTEHNALQNYYHQNSQRNYWS